MKYLYDYGLPFSEKLAENLKSQYERVNKKKKASLILIDGGVGEGKTTALVECMDYINKLYGLPEVKLKYKDHPQLAMGGVQFTKFFNICYKLKFPVIGYDEAGDFNKRGSLSRFNAMLNRTFETFRGFKIMVIVALPTFTILDNNLFDNNIPRGLLHLKGRTQIDGDFHSYSLTGMNWIRYWHNRLPHGIKYKAYNKVNPNFSGHFLDLPPKRAKRLDIISTKGKIDILRKQSIIMEGLIGYKELSEKLGYDTRTIKKYIAELKIKPTRIIKRAYYFDDDVFNKLSSHIEEVGRKR